MTIPELESYITKLLPMIRHRFVKTDDDEDACQKALIDLARKADILCIVNDDSFIQHFLSYYKTIQWAERTAKARVFKSGRFFQRITTFEESNSDFDNPTEKDWSRPLESGPHAIEDCYDPPIVDPWSTIHMKAVEFIEQLPTDAMKHIFILYYIEGYTLNEVAERVGLKKSRIGEILTKGIKHLQRLEK